MRLRVGYYTPDDVYENLLDWLIKPDSRWLDVGSGRDVFPTNPALAEKLSKRCGVLVGVDPDATVRENAFLHERVQKPLEEFDAARFDVITARMVVEHVQDPSKFVASLRRLCAPGGLVVIYTVNKRSLVSALSWLIPFAFHRHITAMLWGRKEDESFPVEYRMNTRRELTALMRGAGFEERNFEYLDDCRTFGRFWLGTQLELLLWRALKALGFGYPETCLLAVYQRADQ